MADAEEKEKKLAAAKKRVGGLSLVHSKSSIELSITSEITNLILVTILVRAIEEAEREGQKIRQWNEEG